ncbi:MAG: hypothetical protein ABW199_07340 [Caulobacterales bacterium]
MLFRAFVIASAVCMTSLAFNIAMAEDMATQSAAIGGVSFAEPSSGIGAISRSASQFQFGVTPEHTQSAQQIAADASALDPTSDRQRYQVSLHQSADLGGGDVVDVSVTQRRTMRVSREGDIEQTGGGFEVRVKRQLQGMVDGFVTDWTPSNWDRPSWFFFVADDDEAISWRPGARNLGGGLHYEEDRIQVGESQAGIGLEAGGIQAALSYVQRDVEGKYGSGEENFTGVTLTWRR